MNPTIRDVSASLPFELPDPVVHLSALRPVLVSIVTRLVTVAATALTAHGYLTDGVAGQVVDPLAQQIVGLLLTSVSIAYGAYIAKHRNDTAKALAVSDPENVVVAK